MMFVRRKIIMAGLMVYLGQVASADVVCAFDTLSTIQGNINVDHGFRIRQDSSSPLLEQRYADGSWHDMGMVERFDRPGFIVFLHLPVGGHEVGRSQMLTVHQSGRASLAIHHGSMGNSSQIRRAWLYQGECSETH
jgi:hypothetical protein